MDRSSFEASRRERAKQREAGGHPTPGDLAAYHAGRLTEERNGQIKDHLVVCEDCALLYDSLIEFEQYRPEPDASGEDPSAAAWQRFRERLREEEVAEAPAPAEEEENTRTVVMPLQRRQVPLWQRPVVAWSVAAGLALCVVGMGIRVGSLQQLLRPRFEPVAEFQGTVRGEESGIETLSGSGLLYLVPETFLTEYEIEISPRVGEDVVVGPLLGVPDRNGALALYLPPSSLPDGEYKARIFGVQNGQRRLLQEHLFQISPAK